MNTGTRQFAGDLRRAVGALGDALSADLADIPQQVAADVVFVRQEILALIDKCEGKESDSATEAVFAGWKPEDCV